MKRLTFVLALAALVGFAFTSPTVVETYSVDVSDSTVEWVAKKVTGKHNGSVDLKSGSLEYTDGYLTGGEFTIDMTSIKVLDLKGNMAGKLEGHLKSPDFFDVENHGEATFKITSAVSRGTKGAYKVKGDLTVKGITKSLTIPAVKLTEDENGVATAEGIELVIDRTEYDVKYGSGTFFGNLGDKTIYDEFTIAVNLKASK